MSQLALSDDELKGNSYVLYNYKYKGDADQFYHWDLMRIMIALQTYLGEQDCHLIQKAFRAAEKRIFFSKS